MSKTLSLGFVSVLLVGCGAYEDTVRAKAADEFACPAQRISLKQASGDGQVRTYQAEGCGKTKVYDASCGLLMCSASEHADVPQGATAAGGPQSAPGTGNDTSSAGPRAPGLVSITIHNNCANTVKMFEGRDPRNSSGTQTQMSSNEVRNFPMTVGDMLWITDDSGNGLSNLTASQGMSDMKILESCTGFAAY